MAGLLSQESGSDSGWAASYKSEGSGGGSDDDLRDFLEGEEVTSSLKKDNSNGDGWGGVDLGELDLPGSSSAVGMDEWGLDAAPSTVSVAEGFGESEGPAAPPPPTPEAAAAPKPAKVVKKTKVAKKVSGGKGGEGGEAKPAKKKVVKTVKKKKEGAQAPSLLGGSNSATEAAPSYALPPPPPLNTGVEPSEGQVATDEADGWDGAEADSDALSVQELRDLPAAPPPPAVAPAEGALEFPPNAVQSSDPLIHSEGESAAVAQPPKVHLSSAPPFEGAVAAEVPAPFPPSAQVAEPAHTVVCSTDPPTAAGAAVVIVAADAAPGQTGAAGELQAEPPVISTGLSGLSTFGGASEAEDDSAFFDRSFGEGGPPVDKVVPEPTVVPPYPLPTGGADPSSFFDAPPSGEEPSPQAAIEPQPPPAAPTGDGASSLHGVQSGEKDASLQVAVGAPPPPVALSGDDASAFFDEPLQSAEVPPQPSVETAQSAGALGGDDATAFCDGRVGVKDGDPSQPAAKALKSDSALGGDAPLDFDEPQSTAEVPPRPSEETEPPRAEAPQTEIDVHSSDNLSKESASEVQGGQVGGGVVESSAAGVGQGEAEVALKASDAGVSAPKKAAYKIVKKNPFGGPDSGDDELTSPFEIATSKAPHVASSGPPPPKPPAAPVAAPISTGGFRIAKKNPFAEASSEGNDDFFGSFGGGSGPPAPQPVPHPPAAPTSWRPAPAATPFGAPGDDGSNFFDEPPSPPPPAPSDLDQAGPPPPAAAWPSVQPESQSQFQQAGWQPQSWGQHQGPDAQTVYQQQQWEYQQQWGGAAQQSEQQQQQQQQQQPYSYHYDQSYGQQESEQQQPYEYQYGESTSYQGQQPAPSEQPYQYQYGAAEQQQSQYAYQHGGQTEQQQQYQSYEQQPYGVASGYGQTEQQQQQQVGYAAYGQQGGGQWGQSGPGSADALHPSAAYSPPSTSGAAPQPKLFVPGAAPTSATATDQSYAQSHGAYDAAYQTAPSWGQQPAAVAQISSPQYSSHSVQPWGQQLHAAIPAAPADDGTSFFDDFADISGAAGEAGLDPALPPPSAPPAAPRASAAAAAKGDEEGFFNNLGDGEGVAESGPVPTEAATPSQGAPVADDQSGEMVPYGIPHQQHEAGAVGEPQPFGAVEPVMDSHGFQQFGQPESASHPPFETSTAQQQQQQPDGQQPYQYQYGGGEAQQQFQYQYGGSEGQQQFQSFGSDQLQSFSETSTYAYQQQQQQQQEPGHQLYASQYGGETTAGGGYGGYGLQDNSAYSGGWGSPKQQPQQYDAYAAQPEQQYASHAAQSSDGYASWDGQQATATPRMMVPSGGGNSAGPPTTAAEAMQSPHGRPACGLMAFAFGGRMVTSTPQVAWGGSSANWWDTRYGAGQFRVGSVKERLVPTHDPVAGVPAAAAGDPLAMAVGGPLGKLSKDKLVKLCQERAAAVQEGSGQVVPGDAATLWQLLGVMVANKGSLRSATKPPSAGSAASVEQQIARLLLPEGQPHTMANTSQLLLPQTPSNEEGAAVEVQQRLMGGDLAGALQVAVTGRLWGMALLIGRRLGPEAMAEVGSKMVAASLSPGSPLHSAALLLAGKPELVVADTGAEAVEAVSAVSGGFMQPVNPGQPAAGMESTWRQHLAILSACRTGAEGAALKQLGDRLLQRGPAMGCAAHLCFLLAEEMPRANAEGTRVCLLGADHIHSPRTYAHDVAAVQRTEVLEWCMAQSSGQAGFCMLPLQPYKLLLAADLIEGGHVQAGLHYAESVGDTLQKMGKVPAGLLVCRAHTSSMLDHLKVYFRHHHMEVSTGGASILGKVDRWINRLMGSEDDDQKGKVEPGGSPLRRVSSGQQLRTDGPPPPAAQPQAPRRASAPNSTGHPTAPPPSAPDSGGGKKAAAQGGDMKRQDSGLMSLVTRVGSITSIFSSGGSGSGGKNKAKMGESNKFYYDEKLKMWREEGVEEIPDLSPPPPPPTSFPTQQPPPATGSPPTAVDGAGGAPGAGSTAPTSLPLGPPPSNMFSKKKSSVGSRYVDTFGGGGGPGPARSSSPKPPLAPGSARNNFFIPQAPSSNAAAPKTNFFVPSAPSSTGSGASQSDSAPAAELHASDGGLRPPQPHAAPTFFTPPAPSSTGASSAGEPSEPPPPAAPHHHRLPSPAGSLDMGGDLYTTYSDADLAAKDAPPTADLPLPPPPTLSPFGATVTPFGGPQPSEWAEPPTASADSGPASHHSTAAADPPTAPPPPPPAGALAEGWAGGDAAPPFDDSPAEDDMQDLDF